MGGAEEDVEVGRGDGMIHPPKLLQYTCQVDGTIFQFYFGPYPTCPVCGRNYYLQLDYIDGKPDFTPYEPTIEVKG